MPHTAPCNCTEELRRALPPAVVLLRADLVRSNFLDSQLLMFKGSFGKACSGALSCSWCFSRAISSRACAASPFACRAHAAVRHCCRPLYPAGRDGIRASRNVHKECEEQCTCELAAVVLRNSKRQPSICHKAS